MNVDPYSILIVLSILVVLSYLFNYLATILRIPSVLLLLASGIGLKYAAEYIGFSIPGTQILLQILGITGLIFIVLEASLDLSIERKKIKLISRAFLSALILLVLTSGAIAFIFIQYYQVDFQQALLHAIPLSVISSAIAIPSVQNLEEERKEFIVYESTFSDILGIIAFNYVSIEHTTGLGSVMHFSWEIVLIMLISVVSTILLVFLLNHTTTHIRFFLTFAILILIYSLAKFLHLPSLILVLCFGMVLNNFRHFNYPIVRLFLSFTRIEDVTKEMKLITAETAFIIRTFFFLLFGFSLNLTLLWNHQVIVIGIVIVAATIVLRFIFLGVVLRVKSIPLMLITPRGLITVILFYSIPESRRMLELDEGIVFMVIVFTGLIMALGLLLNKTKPVEINS